MVNLASSTKQIEQFITSSVAEFQAEYGKPYSIGIYCCPWAGWLTTNFNLDKTDGETALNCPDFQFVESDFLDLAEWQEEYEQDSPVFHINGKPIDYSHESGDEKFNELLFGYLKPMLIRLKADYQSVFILQMLDSKFVEEL